MGLDMFLYHKQFVWSENGKKAVIEIPGMTIDPERVKYITQEVGYWRKANAVHDWFVTNVQGGEDDCEEYKVSREQLTSLLGIVTTILEDHDRATELLPTKDGFFFGSTNYDTWYFSDLENTKTILNEALANESGDFIYRASW